MSWLPRAGSGEASGRKRKEKKKEGGSRSPIVGVARAQLGVSFTDDVSGRPNPATNQAADEDRLAFSSDSARRRFEAVPPYQGKPTRITREPSRKSSESRRRRTNARPPHTIEMSAPTLDQAAASRLDQEKTAPAQTFWLKEPEYGRAKEPPPESLARYFLPPARAARRQDDARAVRLAHAGWTSETGNRSRRITRQLDFPQHNKTRGARGPNSESPAIGKVLERTTGTVRRPRPSLPTKKSEALGG